MTREEAIIQCRKINELVKRGIAGEKESAALRLASIMGRHGIEPHEIEGEQIVLDSFICTNEQTKFAIQVIASVLGKKFKAYKQGKRIYFHSPISKVSEIKDRWLHYLKLWESELDAFYSAFIQKHKLYSKPTESDEKKNTRPLTPEEKAKLLRMFQMMEAMEYSDYKKKIVF